MVNTARQGAAFERRIIADLKQHGYDCIRSAASKGAVDIVAVGPVIPHSDHAWVRLPVLFVQAKLSKPLISPAERLAVQDLALRANALPLVSWWAEDEITGLKRVHYRQLTGPGAKDWAHWAPGKDN